jgi:cytochrome c5
MSDSLEEAHTGPIKTPKQLLIAVLFSFLVPVFAIIALVVFVVSENKPAGTNDIDKYVLGGVTAQDLERGVTDRIRKVGTVEIRDANRPLAAGEQVFKVQCAACHTTGAAGAPKQGDVAAWANRIRSGFDALVTSALKGKGAMPAQGGGDFSDVEIARAVAYLANAGGAKFAEPAAPGAPAAAAAPAGAVPAAAAVPAVAPAAPVAAGPAAGAAPAAPATQVAAAGASQEPHRPPPRPRLLPPVLRARRSTSRPAWCATPPVWPVPRSSATRPPGRRVLRKACRRW